ncbi:hypothetical protein CSIM01_10587 [Colletotrichum simmondsii]|uniref:Uncharacterized protein n=1 Tax=Colletotrichum simmondsii TaxID=703756 RepID=A0A135SCH9_9PEZI|nr:hypothetical protein CSIM01_10587 [Colletotrichum simmondsii]
MSSQAQTSTSNPTSAPGLSNNSGGDDGDGGDDDRKRINPNRAHCKNIMDFAAGDTEKPPETQEQAAKREKIEEFAFDRDAKGNLQNSNYRHASGRYNEHGRTGSDTIPEESPSPSSKAGKLKSGEGGNEDNTGTSANDKTDIRDEAGDKRGADTSADDGTGNSDEESDQNPPPITPCRPQ